MIPNCTHTRALHSSPVLHQRAAARTGLHPHCLCTAWWTTVNPGSTGGPFSSTGGTPTSQVLLQRLLVQGVVGNHRVAAALVARGCGWGAVRATFGAAALLQRLSVCGVVRMRASIACMHVCTFISLCSVNVCIEPERREQSLNSQQLSTMGWASLLHGMGELRCSRA